MIIHGFGACGSFDEIGNYSHGHYSLDAGYVSRAAYAMPHLAAFPVTEVHDVFDGYSHLVDLEMPAIATPNAWATAGLFRWNKAIFFGDLKRYSISGNWHLGIGGWIYKSPAGLLWHMLAVRPDSSTLLIQTKPLSQSTAGTFTTLVTIDISGYQVGDRFFVNFDPKCSGRAAIQCHAQYGEFMTPWLEYCFETTITGGDLLTSLPVVAYQKTFDILDNAKNGMTQGLFYSGALQRTPSITSSYVDNTTTGPPPNYFVTGDYFYTYTAGYANIAGEYSNRSNKIERVFAIAYKKTGQRSVFAYRNRTDLFFPGLEVVSVNGNKTVYWDGTTTINFPTSQTANPTMNLRKVQINTKALDLLVDGVAIVTFKQETDNTRTSVQTVTTGPVQDNTTPPGPAPVTGDSQLASGVWLWDEGSTRIQMLTPNSFGIMAEISNAWKIYAWASADFSGKPGVLTPDQLTAKKFSFDPESGQYNRRIIKWF